MLTRVLLFKGAGGQHACAIARLLGISTIYIHRFASILSAYGIGMADLVEVCFLSASGELLVCVLTIIDRRCKSPWAPS